MNDGRGKHPQTSALLHASATVRLSPPPFEVIVLSAFPEVLSVESKFYEAKGWTTLLYESDLNEWRIKVRSKFEYIAKRVQATRTIGDVEYKTDYCILAALKEPEAASFLRLPYAWRSTELLDSTEFHVGECSVMGNQKSIVCGNAFHMGMVHASLLCAKAWHYFRPRFTIMIGIAAGVKGSANLGDILIAEEVWDYGAGKRAESADRKQVFIPDPRHINAEHALVEALWTFGQDKSLCSAIESRWPARLPSTRLRVLKGPVASGASVIASDSIVDGILANNRKLIGLEMESFGFYSACEYLPRPRPKYICVKSVCDFANAEKNDDFQDYAAFTSAEFVRLAIESGILERY